MGKPESENATVLSQTGDENVTMPAYDRIRCFANNDFASVTPYAFVSHTKMLIFFQKCQPLNFSLEKS